MRTINLSLIILWIVIVNVTTSIKCDLGDECVTNCDLSNHTNIIVDCGFGFYCPKDAEPVRCPKGYYCPTPTEKFKCPSGKFCPTKSWKPKDCQHLSTCPEGSYRYTFYGFFIYMFIAASYLTVVYFLFVTLKTGGEARPVFLSKFVHRILSKFAVRALTVESALVDQQDVQLDFLFEGLRVEIRPGNFISKRFNDKKTILEGASGHFRSGRLAAIMGPSGSGKTTLMNVLLGKLRFTGTLRTSGKISQLKSHIGFVPQDDIMMPTLSVREVLTHSALTRLPTSMSYAEKIAAVNKVIKVLQLENVQNSIIGDSEHRGISGGEKKRVNIGIELVSGIKSQFISNFVEPRVLCLDEPTTGLDSSVSKDIMLYLKDIARRTGLTVIAIIHQPRYDIIKECDDLVLLGLGGHTVYSGPADRALDYFASIGFVCPEHANPADFYLDIITGETNWEGVPEYVPSDLFDYWEKNKADWSEVSKLTKTASKLEPPKKKESPSFFWQFVFYSYRAWIQNTRNWSGRMIDLAMNIFAGIVVGISFFSADIYLEPLPYYYYEYCPSIVRDAFCYGAEKDNIPRLAVYLCMSTGLVVVTIYTKSLYNERLVFWREASSGANRLAYYLAKNVTDLEGVIVNTLVFTSAFIFVASPAGTFADYFVSLFLYQYCLVAISYICTWIPPYPTLLAVIVALISGLGTGSSQSVKDMGILGTIQWARWFGEGHYILELREEFIYPAYRQHLRDAVHSLFTYNLDNFHMDLGAMFIVGTVLRLIGFLFLIGTNREKQK